MTLIAPPPTSLMFDGPQDVDIYRTNGEEFLNIYRDVCGLQPNEKMLDVGSGIGRKTLPLTDYFTSEAVYEGIDVTKIGVDWCSENITSRFPNFRFQHIDVYNATYNPQGKIKPSEYRFPFEDNTFDFVMLGSVFTHMRYHDLCHYLAEVRRVLKPGGRCLITYFLLRDVVDVAQFPHRHEVGRMAVKEFPEQAIAFYVEPIWLAYENVGLTITSTHQGTWSGRSGLSYQDMILAVKPE